ncbi:MAG: aminotransferase class I/II-fold pyridoxal phosphate-dependent enzyme, partial [Methyloligellaceae bacterium]
ALRDGENFIRELQARYRTGRDIVMRELAGHPRIEITEPQGSFYVFAKVPGLGSSREFARRLLDEESVGVAPGFTFGPGNEEYFRLCYAQSHARLREALQRICRFLDRHDNDL